MIIKIFNNFTKWHTEVETQIRLKKLKKAPSEIESKLF